MKYENSNVIALVILLAIIIAGAFGWVNNLVQLIHMSELNGMMALRIIGAFIPPVGAFLGYI